MTVETKTTLGQFFKILWDFLCAVNVPGTDLKLIHLLIAPLGAVVFITILKKFLDVGAAESNVFANININSAKNRYKEKQERHNYNNGNKGE